MGLTRTARSNGRVTRRAATQAVGASGLQEQFGRIEDDFLREWNGAEKVKRVDQMLRNSPIIGAMRMAVEMQIRGVSWSVTNGDESIPAVSPDADSVEDDRLKLIADSLNNMSETWDDHVSDALNAIWYGWVMMTDQYDRDGARLLWNRFKMLGHDTVSRWVYDPPDRPGVGQLVGLQQHPYLWPEMIPIDRIINYRLRKPLDNPEGESLLRPAWIPFYYASNLQETEGIGWERFAAGLPVVTMPRGADPSESGDDYKKAAKIARNIRTDEQGGIVLPPPSGDTENDRWHIELMSVNVASNLGNLGSAIARYEKRILMSFLAQFLMLGMDNTGALATFEGGNAFFTAAINAIADMISETFTNQAIYRLLRLNGMDATGIKLEHTPAGDIDIQVMADFLQKTGTLLSWTPEDEAWLRSITRMPDKDVSEIEALQEVEQAAQPQPQEELPQPELQLDLFAANNAPDDDDRRKLERKWTRRAVAYFKEAQARIVKGVK